MNFIVHLIFIVLYFAPFNTWKIGDFGLTTAGTTNRNLTTAHARGTACHRAPELIQEDPSFTNKVDIFAMGCILYEIACNGKKLFVGDFDVRENIGVANARFSVLQLPEIYGDPLCSSVLGSKDNSIPRRIQDMITREPYVRPSARELRVIFKGYCYLTEGQEYKKRRKFGEAARSLNLASGHGMRVPAVYELAGDCWLKVNQYVEAAKSFEAAVPPGARDPQLYYRAAQLYERCRHNDSAIINYRKALELDPAPAVIDLMKFVELCITEETFEEAREAYIKAFKMNGGHPYSSRSNEIAKVFVALGEIDMAAEMCQSALERGFPKFKIEDVYQEALALQAVAFRKAGRNMQISSNTEKRSAIEKIFGKKRRNPSQSFSRRSHDDIMDIVARGIF